MCLVLPTLARTKYPMCVQPHRFGDVSFVRSSFRQRQPSGTPKNKCFGCWAGCHEQTDWVCQVVSVVFLCLSQQPVRSPSMNKAWTHVVPFLLHHNEFEGQRWNYMMHYPGGCGQNCPCCRSHVLQDAHPDLHCPECYAGWVLSTLSTDVKAACNAFAVEYNHPCKCGECCPNSFARGWECPHALRARE